ncbi:MAG: S9 family peptidase [Bacteroidia bacterium]
MKSFKILLPAIFLWSCQHIHKNTTLFSWPNAKPPIAMQKEHIRIIHGDTVRDPYFWLKDYYAKGPDSTQVIDYLQAENRYTDSMMAGTAKLQKQLFDEMKGRINDNDASAPVFENGYYYYFRTELGKQYSTYCRKKGTLDAPEEILLDVNSLSVGKSFFNVTGYDVSDDNILLAYAVDELGRRQYTIHIKNLLTGETYKDAIEGTKGDPCFAADNKTIFYTANNPQTLLSEKIKRHVLGEDFTRDAIVFNETDKSNYIGVSRSKNKKYIIITSQATLSSEVKIIDAHKPDAPYRIFAGRRPNVLYSIVPLEEKFLVLTNWNAENFRLMECAIDQTESAFWKEVIPHRRDVLLKWVDEFREFLVIEERKGGQTQLRFLNRNNNESHYLAFDEPVYTAYPGLNPNYDSKLYRYNYSSQVTPYSVYHYDYVKKEKILLKQKPVGSYDPKQYVQERIFADARDGSKVPISIVYKKNFEKNGKGPLLLNGYGAIGYSLDPVFNSERISLLDRGFAFAIAHIRGGDDLGRHWYEQGKLMQKKNTFTDFIDCAKYLVENHYTSPEHLYAQGGSSGGLLMGAVINMEPRLWQGVIANVPFVDVVNSMLDENMPLTTNEYDEWGNPNNKDAYFYMKSYSPYENVERKDYPNLLVIAGLHDSQVQYFEPAKWVAKLRSMKTDKNALLLKTDLDSGHSGASGRFDYLKQIALEYAFLISLENMQMPIAK